MNRPGPLYTIGYSAGLGLGFLAMPFSKKLRRGIQARRGLLGRLERAREAWGGDRPVWFHVASSGELESVLPILDALKARRPRLPLLLTYFSPSAERAIRLETERRVQTGTSTPWDYADYSPYDLPRITKRAVRAVSPRAFVSIQREIWPSILTRCAEASIPRFLYAAHFPDDWSPRRHQRRWFDLFDAILTTSALSAERALAWQFSMPSTVEALGDPRIERVLARRNQQGVPSWTQYFDANRTLVLASVWPRDLVALGPSLKNLSADGLTRLVVVPHEPNSGVERRIMKLLAGGGRPVRRWSDWCQSPDSTSHLYVDKIGILAELYQIAGAVFVGNSFGPRVHNVLEPAVYGAPIFTGPAIQNSAEACDLRDRSLLIVLLPGMDLAEKCRALLADPVRRSKLARELTGYVCDRSNQGERYAVHLLSQIE